MGQARSWCCLLEFNQSRGLTRCQQVLGPLAGNECLLPRSSQEYSMSPDLHSETKWRFTTEQGQQGVYNSASEMVVAVTIPPFISVKLMGQWVSGDCPILPLAFQEILTPSAHSSELHRTQGGARADSVVPVGGCSTQLCRASQPLCSCAWGPSGHHGSMLPRVRSRRSYPRSNCQLHCPSGRFTGSLQRDWTQVPTEGNCSSVCTWLSFLPSLSHAPPLFASASWDHLPLN